MKIIERLFVESSLWSHGLRFDDRVFVSGSVSPAAGGPVEADQVDQWLIRLPRGQRQGVLVCAPMI
jgi:hypothetical protein